MKRYGYFRIEINNATIYGINLFFKLDEITTDIINHGYYPHVFVTKKDNKLNFQFITTDADEYKKQLIIATKLCYKIAMERVHTKYKNLLNKLTF